MDGTGISTDSFDVILVGGGFAGLVTAAALANGRRRILVLEARDALANRFSGELDRYAHRLEGFTGEFTAIVSRQLEGGVR